MSKIIETFGYPRAALVGNPSDGFHGRTIAVTFSNYRARVRVTPSENLTLKPQNAKAMNFDSMETLLHGIRKNGYPNSTALLQATIKKLAEYCAGKGIDLSPQGFTLESESDIPFQVGIAGSSAIIIAVLRALMQHYQVDINKPELADLALSVETEELGIPGGLQDRVAQVYQGLTYMDFNRTYFDQQGYGHYESLDHSQLPSLYIAWRQSIAEGSEVFHSDIRARYAKGDDTVLKAIAHWKSLTIQFRDALLDKNDERMRQTMNENFDRRAEMYEISPGNLEMIRIARECGASAKFTGSGGAAIGIYAGEDMYQKLQNRFSDRNIQLFKPVIVHTENREN